MRGNQVRQPLLATTGGAVPPLPTTPNTTLPPTQNSSLPPDTVTVQPPITIFTDQVATFQATIDSLQSQNEDLQQSIDAIARNQTFMTQ
ncbi:hypothetical protein ACLB2K_043787 [Fragaria x ananassa]